MRDWTDYVHTGFLPVGKRSPSRLGISTWNSLREGIRGWLYFVIGVWGSLWNAVIWRISYKNVELTTKILCSRTEICIYLFVLSCIHYQVLCIFFFCLKVPSCLVRKTSVGCCSVLLAWTWVSHLIALILCPLIYKWE